MRVRILSGNQAGEIQEVDPVQGEHMVHFGYAELAAEPAALAPAPVPTPPDREALLAAARRTLARLGGSSEHA